MKRRQHGVNLDDGIALESRDEFARLYVHARADEAHRLEDWLMEPESEALILAGQIGSGKTTLLNHLLHAGPQYGIIRVQFDQTPLDETHGAFWAVLFGALLKEALSLECDCEGLGLALDDFELTRQRDWVALKRLLVGKPRSAVAATRTQRAYDVFGNNVKLAQRACGELLERIETVTGCSPPIIAEGVDKFAVGHSSYLGLTEVLDFLGQHKTLYEANAVHLFDKGREWVQSDKLFIGVLPDGAIAAMFEKRLGSYAPLYQDSFPLLVECSGGNARQALRLLNGFYFRRTQRRNDRTAAFALTAHRVAQDFLQFAFERFPAEMLAVLKRDKFIEPAVLTNQETATDARDIIYRNWAYLQSAPGPGESRWPLLVNPLVSDAVAWEKVMPEPPELKAARRWAKDKHMSPMGLSLPDDENGRRDRWPQVWEELSSSESSEDELSIVGLLEETASSLFSANRQDRVMVSYCDPLNLNVAVDFLIGKAATYGPFVCRELHLKGGEGTDPVVDLVSQVKAKDLSIVYAVFMEGSWTKAQLDALERLRDRFVETQMIWFVEHAALLNYLPHWPQFRQLMRFYVLEDDYLGSLSAEEMRADLEMLEDIGADREGGIGRLKSVLEYMKERGGAS